jgi:Viral BACON domain
MIASTIQKITHHLVISFLFLLLASCGGGGGSASLVNGGIQITPTSVEMAGIQDSNTSANKTIEIQIVNQEVAYIAAGYADGVTQATWLQANIVGTPPNLSLQLTVVASNLEAGVYNTTLRIATGNKNQALLGYVDLPVKYTLTKQLGVQQKEIVFDYVPGGPGGAPSNVADIFGKGISWTAKASEPWVSLSLNQGTAPNQVLVGINSSGLAPGNYSATATFTPTDGTPPAEVKVLLNLRASTLQVASSGLNFPVVQGGTLYPSYLYISSNGSPLTWTATTDQAWIKLAATSGTATNAYSSPSNPIIVNVDINGLAIGDYSGSIKITDQNGGAYTAAVTLSIRKPQLQGTSYPLNFESVVNGPVSGEQIIYISSEGAAIDWTASANQSWIKLSSKIGTTPAQLTVSVDPVGMASGNYSGAIVVSSAGNGSLNITVSYVVKSPALQVGELYSNNQLSFYGTNGAIIQPQVANVKTNNGRPATWTATSNTSWLKIGKAAGTTPDTIEVGVHPELANLASGSYGALINFSAVIDGQTVSSVATVNLTLNKPFIQISPQEIKLGGPAGHDLTPQPILLTMDTGTPITWNVAASEPWIKLDKTTFTTLVNQYQLPVVSVSPNAATLAKGKYSGRLTFTAKVNGDNLLYDLPVSMAVDSHRLLLSDSGVALAKTPGLSKLTRSVKITENFGAEANWNAVSDVPWLSVTPTGKTAGTLVLTADPASLAQDKLYLATVSVGSPDTTIENSEKIRVGFWVGSSGLASTLKINSAFVEAKADPIRPYVYVHNGASDISVFHIYTGAEIAKISAVAPQLGGMQISSDGKTLYVINRTESNIIPIDLDTRSVAAGWPFAANPFQIVPFKMAYIRANGFGALIISDGYAYHAQTGARLFSQSNNWGDVLSVARNAPIMFSTQSGYAYYGYLRSVFDYSYADNAFYVTSSLPNGYYFSGPTEDIFPRADASRVYIASSGQSDFIQFNGNDLSYIGSLPGAGSPNNILLGMDDRIFAGSSAPNGAIDIWVYDKNGFPVTTLRAAGPSKSLLKRQLILSGDGLVLIALTDDPTLQIIPINF